jgi:urate oxidase
VTAVLDTAVYGKAGIRLLVVSGDEVTEATVRVMVNGGPAESYTDGDNGRVVTTDALREVATVALAEAGAPTPESAALAVAGTIRGYYPFLPEVEAEVTAVRWQCLPGPGDGFSRRGLPQHRATVTSTADGAALTSGWAGPPVLLTRGSRFTGFIADERTPNQPAEDRAIAGDLELLWSAGGGAAEYGVTRAAVCSAALAAFETCRSESVQHLLTLMAQRALEETPCLRSVEIRMDGIPLGLIDGGDQARRVYVVGAQPRPHTRVSLSRVESTEGKLS